MRASFLQDIRSLWSVRGYPLFIAFKAIAMASAWINLTVLMPVLVFQFFANGRPGRHIDRVRDGVGSMHGNAASRGGNAPASARQQGVRVEGTAFLRRVTEGDGFAYHWVLHDHGHAFRCTHLLAA